MADTRIKDLPVGTFTSGEKVGSDSNANGTRQFDVGAIINGVLDSVRNQPVGTFTSGEKLLTDSLANGARQIDVDVVIAGVLAAVASLPVGAVTAGKKMLLDNAGASEQADVQDVINATLGDISNRVVGTFTAGEKLVTDSAGNGVRQIDVQAIIDAYNAAIAAALLGYINTASNGVVEAPSGNVQLGGPLITNTAVGAGGSGFSLQCAADILTAIADNGMTLDTLAGTMKLLGTSVPSVGDVLTAQAADGSAAWVTPAARAYGEVGMNPGGPGTTFNIALAGTPVKWTGLTLGSFDGGGLVTYAGDQFVVNAGGDGLYRVSCDMGFDGDNDNYFMQLYKNGVAVGDIQTVRTIAGANEGSWSMGGYIDMVATDFLEIWFDAGSNNRNLRVWYSNWNIERIDP